MTTKGCTHCLVTHPAVVTGDCLCGRWLGSAVVALQSRREEHSAESRQALLESARSQFAQRGYSDASLDQIAEAARLTKGALYWHFGSKRGLFRAVVEDLERSAATRLQQVGTAAPDPWQAALAVMSEFLDICCDPTYGRVVLREGPVALSYVEWSEYMEQYSYGLTRRLLGALIEGRYVDPLPLDAWSRVVLGELSAAALLLAETEDSEKRHVRRDIEAVIQRVLEGLRPPGRGST